MAWLLTGLVPLAVWLRTETGATGASYLCLVLLLTPALALGAVLARRDRRSVRRALGPVLLCLLLTAAAALLTVTIAASILSLQQALHS